MHRLCRGSLVLTTALLLPAAVARAQQSSGPPGIGAAAFARLDELPRLRQSLFVGNVSSYDPSEQNDDGFSGEHSFIRKEGDGLVIAELTGPGVLYRFHTPTPTDDSVDFYFDGESQARLSLPMRDLFAGRHPPFTPPLAVYGVGGYVTYVPIAFERSLKVVVRAKRVQFIQFNYARYSANAGIRSWRASDPPDANVARARWVHGYARYLDMFPARQGHIDCSSGRTDPAQPDQSQLWRGL